MFFGRILLRHGLYLRRCFSSSRLATIRDGPLLKDFVQPAQLCDHLELSDDPPYLLEREHEHKLAFIETYGCQMNVNDTEIAWSILEKANYERAASVQDADVVLLMTCAIREGAENKIWHRLHELKHLKKQRKNRSLQIGVLGCMAERLKEQLLEREKSVDIIAGPDSYRDLPRLLSLATHGQPGVNVQLSLEETYADVVPVRTNMQSKSAYVSIMRGCNNMCSYCIVPFTRGRERSRPVSSILDEVRHLSEQGVKEVMLLGQNVNSYRDSTKESEIFLSASSNSATTRLSPGFGTVYKLNSGGVRFADLLHQVAQIDPEMRIRFTSPHPKDFPDEVLSVMGSHANICRHIHLPAQSGSTSVLERMRRHYSREAYLECVARIRQLLPGVSLTSDFICGFCGETSSEHADTVDLVEKVRYAFCYVFAYSMRAKTKAHRTLVDDVAEDVKKQRVAEVLNTFREGALIRHTEQIGTEQVVLVEGTSRRSAEFLAGRNDGFTKVIFPSIAVPATQDDEMRLLQPGDYVRVKIESCTSQVLKGTPICRTTLKDSPEAVVHQVADQNVRSIV